MEVIISIFESSSMSVSEKEKGEDHELAESGLMGLALSDDHDGKIHGGGGGGGEGEDSSSSPAAVPMIMELNLIGLIGGAAADAAEEKGRASPGEAESEQQRVFSCNSCRRKFYSSQALGGHQNAHKREKTLAKREARAVGGSGAHHLYGHRRIVRGYPGLYGGGVGGRPLGMQAHSMAHKPCLGAAGMVHGRHGWAWPAMFGRQQAGIARLLGDELHGGGRMASAARFDEHMPATGYRWIGGRSTSQLVEVHEEEPKLDLSLKL